MSREPGKSGQPPEDVELHSGSLVDSGRGGNVSEVHHAECHWVCDNTVSRFITHLDTQTVSAMGITTSIDVSLGPLKQKKTEQTVKVLLQVWVMRIKTGHKSWHELPFRRLLVEPLPHLWILSGVETWKAIDDCAPAGFQSNPWQQMSVRGLFFWGATEKLISSCSD